MAGKSFASHVSHFSAFKLLPVWEEPICGNVTPPFTDLATIYVACEHKYLFALDPNTTGDRHVRWRYELNEIMTAMESLEDGVLVSSHHDLFAFDGTTGKVRWKYKLRALGPKSGAFLVPGASHIKHVPPYIHFLNHSGLFTLNSRTGKERYFTSSWREWDHLVVDSSLIYVSNKYDGIIEALLPETSWPAWYFECKASIKVAPAVDDYFVYCASHDGYLHVIEKRTGQLRASIQIKDQATATPVSGGDVLFVVTEQGSVIALDVRRARAASETNGPLDPSNETCLWKFETQGERLQSPLLFDEALFVATKEGLIYGLDAQTGQLIWQHDLDTPGSIGLCRSGNTLFAAAPGKVVGFVAPAVSGSRPISARSSQPEQQRPAPHLEAGEDLVSSVILVAPVDLQLPDLNLPRKVWSITLPAPVATRIVVATSHVVVGCAEEKVVSVNATDGSILWQTELEGRDVQGICQISPDNVCVADEENLYCFDAATGSRRWLHRTGGSAQCGGDIDDAVVFYILDDGKLVCLDKVAGKALWKRDGEEDSYLGRSSLNDLLLFIGGKHGVRAFLRETGQESWFTSTVGAVVSSPFYFDGRVFAGCADGRLYAFDAGSGDLLWVFKTKDQIRYAPAELADGCVVIAGQDQFVYALNSADGALLWRYALTKLPCGEPCVADQNVFIGTSDGFICALDAETGRLNWKHELGGEKLMVGPTVAGSHLYAATDAGRLICLRLPIEERSKHEFLQ